MTPRDILLTGCSELLTLRGPAPRRGRALGDLGIIRDGAVLIRGGKIAAVGSRREIAKLPEARRARKLDLGGRVVLPGFVDSHTHLVFPASRVREYEMRLAGSSYEEIAGAGGGILSSVKRLRTMPVATLEKQASRWLKVFAEHGTTTVEAKSGYGLDFASEWKILQVQRRLAERGPIEIVSDISRRACTAAEIPHQSRRYIDMIARSWLPRIVKARLAEYCDVFCDRGAFTVAQSRRLLTAARALGMGLRLHGEQIARTGAARLGVELGAASVDHLDQVNDGDIRALAASNTVATLLPGCSFHLGLAKYAPARKLIAAGAIVALATDFNPGTCPSPSMSMALSWPAPDAHAPGGSHRRRHHQSRFLSGTPQAHRLARTGQGCRPRRLRLGRSSRNPVSFWCEPLLPDHEARSHPAFAPAVVTGTRAVSGARGANPLH